MMEYRYEKWSSEEVEVKGKRKKSEIVRWEERQILSKA